MLDAVRNGLGGYRRRRVLHPTLRTKMAKSASQAGSVQSSSTRWSARDHLPQRVTLTDPCAFDEGRLPSLDQRGADGRGGAKMTAYFRIEDDKSSALRWHLGEMLDARLRPYDGRVFAIGKRLTNPEPVVLTISVPGPPLDFTVAAFGVPVVAARAGGPLLELAARDVQLVPASVEGTAGEWFILNCTTTIPCIDEVRTKHFTKWTAADHRADLEGQYRSMVGMRVDAAALNGAQLVRPSGWEVALVVSEGVRSVFENTGVAGATYKLVS